jgi:alkylation response protein AidB-like acyl-CoA dehydrogenase
MMKPMQIDLSNTYDELRQRVRAITDKYPDEYWRELDAERKYPSEFVDEFSRSGLLSALIPKAYGGEGRSLSEAAVIMEEIQAAGCNGGTCHAQMYIMGTLLKYGNEDQKQRYLTKVAAGELRLQVFGVTEEHTGTDTTKLRTFAEKVDGGFRVNGHKFYIGRGQHSDLMLLLARTTPLNEVKKKTEGLSIFLVDMREVRGNELDIRPIRTTMNHSLTEIFINDLFIPDENLVGELGKGFRYILDSMNAERLLIAGECIGDARFFIERATDWANKRELFGRKIGQNQGIQFPIARAYASMKAAEMIVKKGTAMFDAGQKVGEEANMALLLASEASWEAGNAAVQTFGGRGFDANYDIERKFRETRLYQVAPISKNMILAYLSEHVLGLPRSY